VSGIFNTNKVNTMPHQVELTNGFITIPGYPRLVHISEKVGGSKYFTWAEVTAGGYRKWTDKQITWAAVKQARLLDVIRAEIKRPFTVTSWYRTPAVNQAVGGARNSLHLTGAATDFKIGGWESSLANANKIREIGWEGGIGYYPGQGGWFHLSSAPIKERGVTYRGR
jgi:hypothetical protein